MKKTKNSGFTLIELLVVIALTAVLATIGFVSFGGYRNANHLKDEGNKVVAVIQNAHDNSVSQLNGAQWGVHFGNGTSSDVYGEFSGSSFASGTPGPLYGLGYNLAFGDPATSSADIVFNPLTGTLPEDQAVTIVPTPGNGMAENIIVNTLGKITQRFETGLVGYWPLDAGTGVIAYDASGYGNNGTLTNGPTWQSGANCKVGSCLDFNPSFSNYINIPSNTILNPGSGQFSVVLWFRLDSVGSLTGSILYNKENLYEASAGGGYFSYAWQPYWAWTNTFPVSVGQWYQAAVVYDGAKQYVYENGSLAYSRVQTGSMGSNTNDLRIGARGAPGTASAFFPGEIDDVRIYNRALSATEIQDLYNAY